MLQFPPNSGKYRHSYNHRTVQPTFPSSITVLFNAEDPGDETYLESSPVTLFKFLEILKENDQDKLRVLIILALISKSIPRFSIAAKFTFAEGRPIPETRYTDRADLLSFSYRILMFLKYGYS